MFGWSTPLVLRRLSRYGHVVKRLVVRAFPRDWQILSQQQLDWAVACLAACHNLKIFNLRILQPSGKGEQCSLAAVFDTLAEHASELEFLFIQSSWTLDDFVHLVGAVAARTCLKSLKVFPTGRIGFNARQIPSLPCLPVLTELHVPTANLVTMTTFAGTDACQVLGLAHDQVGDLAHVAKCVGHSVDRLSILSLAPSTYEDSPPIFEVLRRLQVYYGSSVCLLALFDLATPLEILEIAQMNEKVFASLQNFYTRQPRKTLARINISRPQSKQHDNFWMDPGLDAGPETEEELEEERRLKIASHQVLERCIAWAANRGITIEADWYKSDWSALATSAILA